MPSAAHKSSFNWQSAIGNRQFFAWQGLSLRVPTEWNAIKLEGDRAKGFALLADLEAPRLGLRWATPAKKATAADAVRAAMSGEVGVLATGESRELLMPGWSGSLLYCDPEPPGRDVWIGYSDVTSRVVQLTFHSEKRNHVLERQLLPTLTETPDGQPTRWSALDLSCVVPAEYSLAKHQFSAGDLRLLFECGKQRIVIRQIGPAELALSRQPLERWIAQHPLGRQHMYRSVSSTADGRKLERRVRFFLQRRVPREVCVAGRFEESTDRIIIVEAESQQLTEKVLTDVGWARRENANQA